MVPLVPLKEVIVGREEMRWVHGIECEFMNYPKPLLKAREGGDYSFLIDSKASNYIKDILVSKAKRRQGRRF